jgi:hypothetical protein
MATPRKKKGFRTLTVEGVVYRWRLVTGQAASKLTIYGESSSSRRLLVELPGWRDPWLNLSGFTITGETLQLHSSAANEPALITNAFVRRAVLAGVKAGFDPERCDVTMSYRDGAFSDPKTRNIARPDRRRKAARRSRSS